MPVTRVSLEACEDAGDLVITRGSMFGRGFPRQRLEHHPIVPGAQATMVRDERGGQRGRHQAGLGPEFECVAQFLEGNPQPVQLVRLV